MPSKGNANSAGAAPLWAKVLINAQPVKSKSAKKRFSGNPTYRELVHLMIQSAQYSWWLFKNENETGKRLSCAANY
jgi:hypothetical protein